MAADDRTVGAVPPLRLQGPRPTLALDLWTHREVTWLPAGELCRFLLDGESVDLAGSRVEDVELEQGGAGEVSFLLSVDDSPLADRPVRLRLHLAGVDVEGFSDEVVGDRRSLRPVDCLQHDGHGVLRLSVWGGPPGSFPSVTFGASALWWTAEPLDASRPPYVLLMTEYGTDGVWDLATSSRDIKEPLELSDLSVPDALKTRLRRWQTRWEHHGIEDRREAEAIAEELRRCWPESEVLVHH